MRLLLIAAALAIPATIPAAGRAADPAPNPVAGRWTLRLPQGDDGLVFLLNFGETDGKWVGDYLGSTARIKGEPTITGLVVEGPAVRFTLQFSGPNGLAFDGLVAKDGSKISGSLAAFGGPLQLVELRPSKLKRLDEPGRRGPRSC